MDGHGEDLAGGKQSLPITCEGLSSFEDPSSEIMGIHLLEPHTRINER
jgi:hypothetical protein